MASSIVSSTIKNFKLNKIEEQSSLLKIEQILQPNIKKFLKFSYLKSRTLYFVFSHPSITTEFNYSIKTLKSVLNSYDEFNFINDIKAYSDNKPIVKPKREIKITVKREKLEFKNMAKDSDIYRAFERLKSGGDI